MWLLKDSKGKIKYLKPGKTFKVGRKQADVVLENDSSISRTHATLEIILKEQMRTSEVSSTCIVKDAKSKYGTFVIRNNVQMRVPTDGLELEPHDTVKFGLQDHSFVVEYIRFVSVISRLSIDHRKKLKDIMDTIGGIVIDCYDDNCTHLTSTTATSTNKIIAALIAGIPIVNINYWISVLNAIDADENLPDPIEFVLPLEDKGINSQRVSLKPNSKRKILFQGKKFIFFSEKMFKEYKKMIKGAGGKIELYNVNNQMISEDFFADNVIVMQINSESMTDELASFEATLYNTMQKKKCRMISETEIPLAIIYVSLDQYCNVKFNFKELMARKSFKTDTSEILALDTQDVLTSKSNNADITNGASTSKQVLIPETQDFMGDIENDLSVNITNPQKEILNDPKQIYNIEKKLLQPPSSEINILEIEDNHLEIAEDDNNKSKNKYSHNPEIKKTKRENKTNNADHFTEFEKQKSDIKRKDANENEKKENKLCKKEFKKVDKKAWEFDLDDLDEEPKTKIIKKEFTMQDSKSNTEYDTEKSNKIFKKVYKQIPVTRIALSDMTIWRPNS